MIILRQKDFSFIERLKKISNGAIIGAGSSLVFGVPAGIISKISGGSFNKALGYTTLAGAIIGALIGNSVHNTDEQMKKWTAWIKDPENRKKLGNIVDRNLPPNLNKLQKFKEELNKHGEIEDYFDISVSVTIDEFITALGSQIYHSQGKNKVIPENSPIPVMLIDDWLISGLSHILWHSKEQGWIYNGKSISGPKEFILSFVDEVEDIEEEVKETLIELVNKYL